MTRHPLPILVALAGTAWFAPLTLADAASADAAACAGSGVSAPDLDVDGDGRSDVAVGVPGANHGRGAVEIRYGDGHVGTVAPGRGGIPALPAGSRFGASLTAASLNGDSCWDLVVGAPGARVSGRDGAGAVQVVLGGARPAAGPTVTRDTTGVPGRSQVAENFGAAVDARDGILVGAPRTNVRQGEVTYPEAGQVVTLQFSGDAVATTLSSATVRSMHTPQARAHYGAALFNGLVGAPDADTSTRRNAGYVEIGEHGRYGTQTGEHLGASVTARAYDIETSLILVGAPGRTVAGHAGAGAVVMYRDNPEAGQLLEMGRLTQNSKGVPGAAEAGDHFGAVLSANALAPAYTAQVSHVVIGVPGEDIGNKKGAGMIAVQTLRDTGDGPATVSWQGLHQNVRGVAGRAEAGDHFGATVTVGIHRTAADTGYLAVIAGVPGEDIGTRKDAGAIEVFRATKTRPQPASSVLWHRASPHASDAYGAAVL